MRPAIRAALIAAALALGAPLAVGAAPLPKHAAGPGQVIEAGGITLGFRHHGFRGHHGFHGKHRFHSRHFLHHPKRFPRVFHHPKRFHHPGFHHPGFRHKRFRPHGFRHHRRHHRGPGIILILPNVGVVIR